MRTRSSMSPMLLFTAACVALSLIGMRSHLERYITPETGLGYLLGIVGGSFMILLLVYPARKRLPWLAPIGGVKPWFQVHMVLGIVGPMLVLFHSNFRSGATNSNVALFCMLTVSGSGLIGRYFYTRIHTDLYGSQTSLQDLKGQISRMQQVSTSLAFIPDLASRLAAVETAMTAGLEKIPGVLRPAVVALRALTARRRIRAQIRGAALLHARQQEMAVASMQRETEAASELARRHIDLVRRVAELGTYERLFALWHVLHLPLFFMLLAAGIVHVVAVHMY
ncbi:MAG: pyridine nucleotide-disulfide oxidoreductase [Steroidobacteraceae bacterium]